MLPPSAQISQFEKFDAAVYAFKSKYNGLPGDITPANAAAFGMATRSGALGHGDGNGIIGSCAESPGGPTSHAVFGCEDALFWNDLSFAN